MKKTWNYFLNKPERSEFYNVENFNENMDLIDEALINIESKKAIKLDLTSLTSRVTNVELGKASKNRSSTENFNAKEINATEIKIGGNIVYHAGRKPSKSDIGLGSVDNYLSSETYDQLDGTGYKFVLQKGIYTLYSKLKGLIDELLTTKADKNGSSAENFSAKEINAIEVKINSKLVYHEGRKQTKSDLGLGSVDNFSSTSVYKSLDGTGDKFVLQKALKAMYDELSGSVNNVAIIGEPILTLCNDLPDTTNFAWMDGGQLKKSDYPKLWARVEATVNSAVQAVTAGSMTYGVDYFGWYIGDTSDYFRKPNTNGTGHIIRPTSARFPGKYEADDNKAHVHSGSTSTDSHSHTLSNTGSDGYTYYGAAKIYTVNSSGGWQYVGAMNGSISGYSHSHTFTTASSGGSEVKMKNIAGKYYCRLK